MGVWLCLLFINDEAKTHAPFIVARYSSNCIKPNPIKKMHFKRAAVE
jgi:hypothetical protein